MLKMDNQKLLSEEKYQQNNAKVKKVGKMLLIIGVITLVISIALIIIGFVSTGNSASNAFDKVGSNAINNFNSMDQNTVINEAQNTFNSTKDTAKEMFGSVGLFALGGFLNFIGFALTIAGGVVMFIAHRREITAYTTQQVMSVAQEGIEKITPTVANAAGSIAQSISKGIQEGKNEVGNK